MLKNKDIFNILNQKTIFATEKRARKVVGAATILLAFILAVFLQTTVSSAATTVAYECQSLVINVVVSKDHSYTVTEELTLVFQQDMEESVQVQLPNGSFKVTGLTLDGDSESIVTSSDSERYFYISNEDDLTAGEHTYVITYTINEYYERNTNYDLFYFSILSNDWSVPIGELCVTLELPDDFPWDDLQYFAGQYGSNDLGGKLSYTVSGNVVTMTGSHIPENFGLTFKATLPDGYWEGAINNEWANPASIILMIAVLLIIVILWFIGGRDPKVKVESVDDLIDGISPEDVGYLTTRRTTVEDVIATIIYMANKGYLKIIEYAPKKYKLMKLEEPVNEERYLRTFWNSIFEGVYTNRTLDTDELEDRIGDMIEDLEVNVSNGFTSLQLQSITKKSLILTVVSSVILSIAVGAIVGFSYVYAYLDIEWMHCILIAVVTFITLLFANAILTPIYFFNNWSNRIKAVIAVIPYFAVLFYAVYNLHAETSDLSISLELLATGMLSFLMLYLTRARSKENAEIVAKLRGLRKFMSTATYADVAPKLRENPDYYYDLLPFAYLFGIVNRWTDAFVWTEVRYPDWLTFEKDNENFILKRYERARNISDFSRDLNSFTRTMESNFMSYGLRRDIFSRGGKKYKNI